MGPNQKVTAGLIAGVFVFDTGAQEEGAGAAAEPAKVIRIGAIYPLTGSAAREGQESKAVLDLALEVINNPTNLDGIPLARGDAYRLPFADGAFSLQRGDRPQHHHYQN